MSKKIFIIDDEVEIRDYLGEILSDEGFFIEKHENGLSGLEQLMNPNVESPDLIILDLNMPKMGGLENRPGIIINNNGLR